METNYTNGPWLLKQGIIENRNVRWIEEVSYNTVARLPDTLIHPDTTLAMRNAVEWLRERGGDAAVARVVGGGRYLLSQGETGPFTFATCKRLVTAGLAEYVDLNGKKAVRFRLTEQGLSL